MAQDYRHQNESGRWQEHSHSSRGSGGRERFESGNERRYRPDWENRFQESGGQDDYSFEGDRSYAAGGYPEEFGYRRDTYAERDHGYQGGNQRRGYQQRPGGQEGRDEQRFGGSYYDRPSGGQGRNPNYGSRDFGQGGSMYSQGQPHDFNREQGGRGEELNRGRNDYGSGFYGGGSSNYYGPQGGFGSHAGFGSQGDFRSQGFGAQGGFASQGAYGPQAGHASSSPGSTYGRFGNERQQWGESERQSQQQSYRGRGPKGYERSDERLREMVCERLTDDPSIDATEVTVEVTNKVVRLTGIIDDRRTKYLIEDVIEQVGGVRDIDNQLRVQSRSTQSQGSQSGAGSDTAFGSRSSINVGQSGTAGHSALGQSGQGQSGQGQPGQGQSGQSSTSTSSPSKRN